MICITPASASVGVAEECKKFMTPDHIYVDVSSSSPKVMQDVWAVIKDTGVQFADGALLDTVPKSIIPHNEITKANNSSEALIL